MGVRLYWRRPKSTSYVVNERGTVLKAGKPQWTALHLHRITSWFGFGIGNTFIGFMRAAPTEPHNVSGWYEEVHRAELETEGP